MSYNAGDLDLDSGGGFGPYEAEVINAGAGIGEFGAVLILVCKPTNPKRTTQNLHMSMGKGDFEFGGKQQVITTGKGERAFDVTVYDEIVSGPKIKVMTNAGLFINALKHQGFELTSGDMTVFIGMVLDLEELKSNEVIRRFNEGHPDSTLDERTGDYAKGKISIPVKIISIPVKKVSLEESMMEVIEGKTEAEMEMWYKAREGFNGSITPLHKLLTKLEETSVRVINNKYTMKEEQTG